MARPAANPQTQLRPGRITSHNENPSLVALGKLTANEPESYAVRGSDVGRTDGRTDGRAGGRTDGRVDGRTHGRTGGRTDGRRWTDGRMDERSDGWMDGWTDGRPDGRADGRADGRTEGRTAMAKPLPRMPPARSSKIPSRYQAQCAWYPRQPFTKHSALDILTQVRSQELENTIQIPSAVRLVSEAVIYQAQCA